MESSSHQRMLCCAAVVSLFVVVVQRPPRIEWSANRLGSFQEHSFEFPTGRVKKIAIFCPLGSETWKIHEMKRKHGNLSSSSLLHHGKSYALGNGSLDHLCCSCQSRILSITCSSWWCFVGRPKQCEFTEVATTPQVELGVLLVRSFSKRCNDAKWSVLIQFRFALSFLQLRAMSSVNYHCGKCLEKKMNKRIINIINHRATSASPRELTALPSLLAVRFSKSMFSSKSNQVPRKPLNKLP